MNFDLPEHLPPLLERMDAFIEAEIVPLQAPLARDARHRPETLATGPRRSPLARDARHWPETLATGPRRPPLAGDLCPEWAPVREWRFLIWPLAAPPEHLI